MKQRMIAVEATCRHCGNVQVVMSPHLHIPRCSKCRKPMYAKPNAARGKP